LPGDGNAGLVFRFRDVVGSGPLYLADFERFLERVPELRWWQMLDVTYLVTGRQIEHGAFKLIEESAGQRLYQAFLGGQPAWIVHEWAPAASSADAIEQTADEGLDPLRTAVLEATPSPAPLPAINEESVRVAGFRPQRVTLDVSLSTPGVVVLSEVAYPGWQVRVDGRPAIAVRAYGLLRAVALPAGDWRIEWRFVPTSALLGLGISALTALALLGTAWRRRVMSKSAEPSTNGARINE